MSKKKKRYISARFLWLIFVVSEILFGITFYRIPLFPKKWSLIVLGVLLVITFLTFKLNIHTKARNRFTKFVNVTLTLCMLCMSFIMPYEIDKVSDLFNQVVGQKITIKVYELKKEYTNKYGLEYMDCLNSDGSPNYENMSGYTIATTLSVDRDNQRYALNCLKDKTSLNSVDASSTIESFEMLRRGEAEFVMVSENYESLISGEEYHYLDDVELVCSFVREIDSSLFKKNSDSLTDNTFAIFIGGNDEEGELLMNGRTDVDMILVCNPKSHMIAIVSVPRDSYLPNPSYDNKYDKLTHFGLSGIDNTMLGLSNYLDVNIDRYVVVNFTTYIQIINALGGVDVYNPYEFYYSYDNSAYFPKGDIHLEDWDALAYVRERKSLPDGDFGRSMHQQIVMKAIINKITSAEGIVNFNNILDSLAGKFLSNISSDSIYGLVQKQLNENIEWTIVNYRIIGDLDMDECASMPGQNLSVVKLYPNQVKFVKEEIDKIEAGEVVSQLELPKGVY